MSRDLFLQKFEGATRTCERCSFGIERAAGFDFWLCDICDKEDQGYFGIDKSVDDITWIPLKFPPMGKNTVVGNVFLPNTTPTTSLPPKWAGLQIDRYVYCSFDSDDIDQACVGDLVAKTGYSTCYVVVRTNPVIIKTFGIGS